MRVFKSELTNDNPIIEEKARYFADCFDFILLKIGKYGFPELENHRSLLEKIRFQLFHYDPKYSNYYINNFINNPLLTKKDMLFKKYYPDKINLIKQIKLIEYKDQSIREDIINQLSDIITDFEQSLLKNALEEFQIILHCAEDLTKHDHIQRIEYITTIIITEFRFRGFPIKDIDQLFSRILSKEIKIANEQIVTEFPLPVPLLKKCLSKEPNIEYHQEIVDFMKNRSLREQFNGIYNLYTFNTTESKIIFRILNPKTKRRLNKTYGKVKVTTSCTHFVKSKMNEGYKSFFNNKNQIYIEVRVQASNFDAIEQLALETINKELPKFELFFNTKFTIDLNTFVIESNNIFSMKSELSSMWLNNLNTAKNKTENLLKKVGNSASVAFLHLEGVYAEAERSELPDLKLVNYWRYLESSFLNLGLKAEDIRKTIALILSNYRVANITSDYHQLVIDIMWGKKEGINTYDGILTHFQIAEFLNVNQINAVWISQANVYLNHPFLKSRTNRLLNMSIKKLHDDLIRYYEKILFEVYEQRNFIQHAGINQELALNKLLITLPDIVKGFRQLVLNRVIKKTESTYEEIIKKLKEPTPLYLKLTESKSSVKDL